MRFPVLALLAALFLLSCAAGVVAAEAWRLSDRRTFRIALFWVMPLSLMTLAVFVFGSLKHMLNHQTSDHLGFAAGWHCLGSSPKGASFCLKDVNDASGH